MSRASSVGSEEDLASLQNRRRVIIEKLQRFDTYFKSLTQENLSDDTYIYRLLTRLEKIEPLWYEFNDLQNSIELLQPDDKVENCEIRDDFENKYGDLVADVKRVINCQKASNQSNDPGSSASVVGSQSGSPRKNDIDLPRIKLTNFDGNYSNWLEYKEMFTALVHENTSLSNIKKFYYLRNSLEKDAAKLLKSMEVSSQNYSEAWAMLVDRFENKNLMIHNHIKAIFEYPVMTKESFIELRSLNDEFNKHLRALKSLGEKTEGWDRLIIYLMSIKFDQTTRRDWESYKFEGELPVLKDLSTFLKQKCELLEKIHATKSHEKMGSLGSKPQINKIKNSNSCAVVSPLCFLCKGDHLINSCPTFLNLNVEDRINKIKSLKLCLLCFRDKHPSWRCKAAKCTTCRKSHNDLLHIENYKPRSTVQQTAVSGNSSATQGTEIQQSNTASTGTSLVSANSNVKIMSLDSEKAVASKGVSQILLSTANIKIKYNGRELVCRALLDSGSESNFLSENVCKKLKLEQNPINHIIKGVGESSSKIKSQVQISFESCVSSYKGDISCLILPKITGKLPAMTFSQNLIKIPQGVQLADPNYHTNGEIECLLGSQVFWSVMGPGHIKLEPHQPALHETKLGWVMVGEVTIPDTIGQFTGYNKNCCLSIMDQTERSIVKFWEIENVSTEKALSSSDRYCQEYFAQTTTRDSTGKFVVRIPFKENLSDLGKSRDIALKRFHTLENRLNKNSELKSEYVKFMSEYEQMGHMTETVENDLTKNEGYFIPHHAIIKENSLTTKCRVVFDASSKTESGLSLNMVQHIGPTLQRDLFSILVNFRMYKYAISADISKMYRCILVNEQDQKFQKIFWRSNPDQDLKCYTLQTVSYGTGSAPYLAVRCLFELAYLNENKYPKECKVIKENFYMDDLLAGAQNKQDALELQKGVSRILESAGFSLRKWLCNDRDLLKQFEVDKNLEASILTLGQNEPNKTLGIYWDAFNDKIKYSITYSQYVSKITKRVMLSMVCQIFDPLGLLGPVIVIAKLFIQKLWALKIEWDEAVPDVLLFEWQEFVNQLPEINNFEFPRYALISEYVTIEFHGFCDSSERSYGAVIYIRCVTSSGIVATNLLCSKSRVAPIKQISLPKLELCGAVLLSNLAQKTKKAMQINFHKSFYWTDSTIVLAWINKDATNWRTFVANRVSEIQTLTNISDWYHVSSANNAADVLSRGCLPQQLKSNKMWWYGPEFLESINFEQNLTETASILISESEIPEQKTKTLTHIALPRNCIIFNLLDRFSSVNKLVRIVAYIQRFIYNILKRNTPDLKRSGSLTPKELDDALNLILKVCQINCFPSEYQNLKNGQEINKNSKILSLNPFYHQGLIRVGGRIKNSTQNFDKKHPVLLPKNNILTTLILRNEHQRLFHCGAQQLLSSIRDHYWPISGRDVCRKIAKNCVTCVKARPIIQPYLMGDLPDCRVNSYIPFFNVGCDFGGPLNMRDRKGRNFKILKVYFCLFICMSSKAVHIELVTELTTEAFLSTFKRFISRRGKPANVYSDNGSNFVGSNNELVRIYEFLENESVGIGNELAIQRIKWHFIPARSLSFGGLWEAGIKVSKFHIKRVIGDTPQTFEDFSTILTQIEGILNSRPICPMSSDPEDLSALTPAHLLIGKSITALPDYSYTEVNENRLNKYEKIQSIVQHYWKRWQKEYVSELQIRTKWRVKAAELVRVGTLVLVKNDNPVVCKWQIGRITTLYPGSDNITRVVDIKINGNNIIRRSLRNICVLPVEN